MNRPPLSIPILPTREDYEKKIKNQANALAQMNKNLIRHKTWNKKAAEMLRHLRSQARIAEKKAEETHNNHMLLRRVYEELVERYDALRILAIAKNEYGGTHD